MTKSRSSLLMKEPRVLKCGNHRVALLFLGAAILNTLQTILSVTFLADLDIPLKRIFDNNKNNINNNNHHDLGPLCRYNGQCPTGMTCAVAEGSDKQNKNRILLINETNSEQQQNHHLPGICVPFAISEKHQQMPADTHCLANCQAELEMDEHFYHERFPVVHHHYATPASNGRPVGCVLEYTRQRDHAWSDLHAQDGLYPEDEPQPSIVTWEKTRFRHIQRVDPKIQPMHITTNSDHQETGRIHSTLDIPDTSTPVTWQAYCFAPCHCDSDCGSTTKASSSSRPFVCIKGACQSNVHFWEDTTSMTTESNGHQQTSELVLITGATASYFMGLQNLAASARYWAPRHKLVIYNLGGLEDPDMMSQIEAWPNVLSVEWKESGIPKDGQYPPHVYEHMRACAWKPLIIQQVAQRYSMIFWLDAGSTLTGPLDPIERILRRNGLFLVKGQDENMKYMSHPQTYQWFGFNKTTMVAGPHFGGGTQGHVRNSRFIDSIVNKNAACALDPNCIIPDLVLQDRSRHRYDQTTLSICAYHPLVQAPHHTEYLSAGASTVSADLRNASYRFVLTSRQSCQAYVQIMRSEQSYITNGIVPLDWTNVENRTLRPIPIHKHVTYTDDDSAIQDWKIYIKNHTGYKAALQSQRANGNVVSLSLSLGIGNSNFPKGP